MKNLIKILLKIFGTGVMIGVSACSASVVINPDPDQVSSTASAIADFDLPAGYHADLSTNLMGYDVTAYSRGSGPNHLYLIQSKKESDGEKLAQVLDEMVVGSGDPQTRITVIETRSVTVRGQETTLVISDCVNSDGLAYRQAVVAFQGNGGPALLVFSEPIESWDSDMVDTLLASVH